MSLEKIKPRVVDALSDYTFANVTVTSNIGSGNANLGNIARANFVSTDNLLYANGVAWAFSAGSVVGADTQVQYNDGGSSFGASSAFTFNKTSSTLSVTNITANGARLTSITGANVTGFVPNATYATSAGTATSATTAETVTASSQPNINSVGTLNSLTFIANGNITMSGSLSQLSGSNLLSANYIIGNGYHLTSTAGGNVVGQVTYAGTANSVAGANVVGAVTYAATANAVSGSNVFGQVGNALVAGTVYEPSQTTITQVGTLVSLTAGNINLSYTTTSTANLGNVVRSNYFVGDGSGLTGITVSGAYSNTNASAYLATATFTTTGNITANIITATTFSGNGSGITYVAGANVSGNVTSAVQSHYANIANSVTFTNVSDKPTTISGYGITDAYSNTNTAAYLTANPPAGTYSNTNVSSYLTANPPTGTYSNTNVSSYLTANPQTGTYSNSNVSSYLPTYSGDLTGANLILSGNLIVSGTTTSVNSTVTRIVDPIFELGGGANGAALSSDDNKDRGVLLHYYSGSATVDAFMGWDDSNAEFAFASNASLSSEVATFNSFGNVRAAYFKGDGSQLTGITSSYSNTNVASYLPTYAGSLTAGNMNLTYATTSTANLGNVVRSNYYYGNGYYLSGVDQLAVGSADVANSIANGTSNINTPTSGGNITVGIGGTANTVIFAKTGNYITTPGNISANYLFGNGYYLSGVDQLAVGSADVANSIANGTSNINTPYNSGPITVGIAGTSNTVIFNSTGVNVAGTLTLGSGTGGNLTGANIISATTLIASANSNAAFFNGNGFYLSGIDAAGRVANGSSNVNIPTASSNITMSVAGTANTVVFTNSGNYITTPGNLSASYLFGNGSQLTGITIAGAYSNTNTAAYLTANPVTGTYSNSNVASYLPTYAGSLTAGNINLSYTTTSTANLGNVVRANYFVGNAAYMTGVDLLNVSGADAANYIANGNSNINTPYLGGPITVGIGGTANTVIFAKTGNYITTPGNLSANYIFGNGYFLDGVTVLEASSADSANNISNGTSNISTPYADGPIPVTIAGIANTVVFKSTGVNVAGYANIGGSITAGTGTGGSITGANAVTSNFFLGNGTYLSSLTGSNVSGNVGSANVSYHTNITANSTTATSMFLTYVSYTGNSSLYIDSTANDLTYQPSSGNLTAAQFVGNGYYLTDITAAGGYSNTNVASYLTANPPTGTYSNTNTAAYLTANPPTGTYSNSNVASYLPTYTGSLTAGNINLSYTTTSTANLGNVVRANYFFGDGSGLTGVDTSPANISNSTSNVQVYTAGPVTTSIGGTANILVVSSTGITVTGSAVIGNLTVTGTTTTVNSTTSRIVDPIIELGGGANGAALTTDDNKDRGLLLHYYSAGATVDAFMGWDDSNAEFGFASNASFTSEVTTFNAYGNIRAAYFKGDGSGLTNIGSPANIYSGTSNVNIPTASSNITVSVAGTANTVVFTNSGNYIVTTGNVKAGYYFGDGSQLTGITATAGATIQSGSSNVNIPAAGSNVVVSVNNTPNVAVITSTGVNVAGTLNVTGVSTLGPASNVQISGAPTSGYILTSDGSGALAWASSGTVAAAISQSSTTLTISSSTLTISLASYVSFEVTLNATISTVTLTNVPSAGNFVSFVLMITGDGTPRSVTWPLSFKWPNGTAPSITSTLNKKDVFVFFTTDGGTTWEAMISGQNL